MMCCKWKVHMKWEQLILWIQGECAHLSQFTSMFACCKLVMFFFAGWVFRGDYKGLVNFSARPGDKARGGAHQHGSPSMGHSWRCWWPIWVGHLNSLALCVMCGLLNHLQNSKLIQCLRSFFIVKVKGL